MAQLQTRVADLENKVYEERFLWIVTLVVIFDAVVLVNATNWSAPIIIGALQLIGLIVLAQKCRVDPIMPLLDKIGGLWNGNKSK